MLCIVLTNVTITLAAPFSPIHLRAESNSIVPGKEVQYLIADDDHTDIDDILKEKREGLWQNPDITPLYLGNTHTRIWVRLRLTSHANVPPDWILQVTWPYFKEIELYLFDTIDGQLIFPKSSMTQAAHNPLAAHLPFAFALSASPAMDRIMYLKLHASVKMLVPLKIVRKSTFEQKTLVRHILLGLFFGALLAMGCYNISLYFFTKDDSYAYYVVYVISIILYTLGMTGLGQTYLWPKNSWLLAHGYGVFSSFSFLTASLFIRRILSLPFYGGWPLHVTNLVAIYWGIMFALYLGPNYQWLVTTEDFGATTTCVALLVTLFFCWYQGSITAKYITIAWTLLLLSTILLMMGLTGIIPFSPMAQNSQNVGLVAEVILLSLTLAERINRTRQEKEEAQEKVLAMERQAKTELEIRVNQRTVELRRTLQALESANKELDTLSLTDDLTQLANRRHFNAVLQQECKRAKRYCQPLSIILADIDHFKMINDTFGHHIGDKCLQHIAHILGSQARRAEDLVARFGGEEFVIILPGTSIEIAAATAERIRHSVQTAPFHTDESDFKITVSLGVAELSSRESETEEELIKKADKAMYHAKNSGRNRVEIF
nr:diguanylate cyclase [Desulfogranum marinum]